MVLKRGYFLCLGTGYSFIHGVNGDSIDSNGYSRMVHCGIVLFVGDGLTPPTWPVGI